MSSRYEVMGTSCRPVWLQGLFLQAPGHQQRRSGEPWIRSPSNFSQAPEHFREARRWIREARCLPTRWGPHSPESLANRRCLRLFSRRAWTVAIETQKHPTPASAISWRVCVDCRARAGGAREGKGAGAGSGPRRRRKLSVLNALGGGSLSLRGGAGPCGSRGR